MKLPTMILVAALLCSCTPSPEVHYNTPTSHQYVDGWRYTVKDGKGYLCREGRGCYAGGEINDYCETPFGRLYWTGFKHFWQPQMNPDFPIGNEID